MFAQRYAAAASAFERQDFIEALTILNGLLDENAAPETRALLAETLERLGLLAEAAEAFEQAAARAGETAPALTKRAAMLYAKAGDDDRAQLLGMRLLPSMPDDPDIAYLLATSFQRNGETELLDRVKNTLVKSDDPAHLKLAGDLIGDEESNPAVLTLFRKLAALRPDDPYTQYKYMSVARDFCDFEAIETQEALIRPHVERRDVAFLGGESGYPNLLHCNDERLNRLATNNGLDVAYALQSAMSAKKRLSGHVWGDRIHIGYLSGDFWDDHATMRLFQSVLEAHDASRFEITLYCHTPRKFIGFDGGNRQKWGRIVEIGEDSDQRAAERMRADGIDILIDLKGHTGGARSRILNLMVAPVQVAWLGFPGSTVNIDCDYVIGDRIVLPNASKPHYHEKFCRLPECYQPNDPVYRARPPAASRADLGLPDDRFVFAAFNTQRKITLPVLECWADILKATRGTLLWVMIDGEIARRNFETAMTKRGVPRDRFVFAAKTSYPAHIARLQAADLALDTFPYNGHTTTSDQLWAGLPVLTVKGSNFASRVTESLLSALGIPDLVAIDRDAYVRRAIELSLDRPALTELKSKIDSNRFTAPLFDAERFCRHLETAYTTMADRARQRLLPDHIDVQALPVRATAFQ